MLHEIESSNGDTEAKKEKQEKNKQMKIIIGYNERKTKGLN